jgi:hypothetical protein
MLLITDKIIEHERVSGNTLNAPLNSAAASTSSSAPPPPQSATDPTVEALQKQQQKQKGKGKGKGKGASNAVWGDIADKGNVNASNVAVVPPTRRPSNGKECQFCDCSGHVESEYFSEKVCKKHGYKIASASASATESLPGAPLQPRLCHPAATLTAQPKPHARDRARKTKGPVGRRRDPGRRNASKKRKWKRPLKAHHGHHVKLGPYDLSRPLLRWTSSLMLLRRTRVAATTPTCRTLATKTEYCHVAHLLGKHRT